MEYQSWFQLLQVVLVTGFSFFILFNMPSARNLGWSYFFGTFIALLSILIFFQAKFFHLRFSLEKAVWKSYLTMSYPLAFAAVLGTIYTTTDLTIMGYFNQLTASGWYSAAQGITGVLLTIAGIIAMAFLPSLSKFYAVSKERFQRIWNYYFQSVLFFSVPFSVGGIVFARKIIDFVYDPSYFPAILSFQLLAVAFAVAGLMGPFVSSLVVANQQKKIFWVSLFSALLNLCLNLTLIPLYSLYGAALSMLATYILFTFLTFNLARKHTDVKPFNFQTLSCILAVLLSTFLMYLAISSPSVYGLHILWALFIAVLIYSISFFAFKKLISYVMEKKPAAP
jgi:O-antigen/teichoic acid export membrane protein